MKKQIILLILAFLFFSLLYFSCSKEKNMSASQITPTSSLDTLRSIDSFSINIAGVKYNASIVQDSIFCTLPFGTDLTVLRPDILYRASNGISPQSGELKDFTNIVVYTLTPGTGIPKKYYASIKAAKSNEKKITSFSFNISLPLVFNNLTVNSTIDTVNKKIKILLPPSVVPTNLIPSITVSNLASVTNTGVAQDFTTPKSYLVTAQNGTTNLYTTEIILPPSSVKDIPTAPKKLCLYYGYPSAVQGSGGNTTIAAAYFAQFDIIVFADTLSATINPHPDHLNTITIINKIKALKPSVKIFGYIDIGVFAAGNPFIHNYPIPVLQQHIDRWKQMSTAVTGVFGDDYGYDYAVDRPRQNAFITYAHSKGLAVFANSWLVQDALGGTDCLLDSTYGDFYLMESFMISQGSYTSLANNIEKANAAYYYMKTKKVGIACVASVPLSSLNANSSLTDNRFKQSWAATAMFNFDAYQFTDTNYSADANATLYNFNNPISSYGNSWQQYDWVKPVNANRYERQTNTNLLFINGDGSTYGNGGY
jgi:hypothetical protein